MNPLGYPGGVQCSSFGIRRGVPFVSAQEDKFVRDSGFEPQGQRPSTKDVVPQAFLLRIFWCVRWGSNPRHAAHKAAALPLSDGRIGHGDKLVVLQAKTDRGETPALPLSYTADAVAGIEPATRRLAICSSTGIRRVLFLSISGASREGRNGVLRCFRRQGVSPRRDATHAFPKGFNSQARSGGQV